MLAPHSSRVYFSARSTAWPTRFPISSAISTAIDCRGNAGTPGTDQWGFARRMDGDGYGLKILNIDEYEQWRIR